MQLVIYSGNVSLTVNLRSL